MIQGWHTSVHGHIRFLGTKTMLLIWTLSVVAFRMTTKELSSCDRDQITWRHNIFTIRPFIEKVCGVTQARQLLMPIGKDSGFKTVNRSEPSEDLRKLKKDSHIWHEGEETKNICIWLQSSLQSGWATITSLLKNGSVGPLGVKLTLNKSHAQDAVIYTCKGIVPGRQNTANLLSFASSNQAEVFTSNF